MICVTYTALSWYIKNASTKILTTLCYHKIILMNRCDPSLSFYPPFGNGFPCRFEYRTPTPHHQLYQIACATTYFGTGIAGMSQITPPKFHTQTIVLNKFKYCVFSKDNSNKPKKYKHPFKRFERAYTVVITKYYIAYITLRTINLSEIGY